MSQFIGEAKEKIGQLTNNPHLEAKGHKQRVEALEKKNMHNPAMIHGQGHNNAQNNCSSGPYGAQDNCAVGNAHHYSASNQPVSGYQDAYQTAGTHGHHGGHIGNVADKTKGIAEQFGGSAEQKLGTAVHNPNMQQRGYEHQIRGANEKISGDRVM
ncbi:hypothetical protein H4S08_003888 [Coemansia sp. RSA 1365]|nr:hypothetical protein H4S08_003888 [Coemansia sp. RSA 1365]